MRMDQRQPLSAFQIVNDWPVEKLERIFRLYGEEAKYRRIAKSIVNNRPIESTTELAQIIVSATGRTYGKHPATKTFQAIRIAVNDELNLIEKVIPLWIKLLNPGGRLGIISFHSLEDRVIKQALRYQSGRCICPPNRPECRCGTATRVEILTRKAIQPSDAEIEQNPRARSAKLRACRKI